MKKIIGRILGEGWRKPPCENTEVCAFFCLLTERKCMLTNKQKKDTILEISIKMK